MPSVIRTTTSSTITTPRHFPAPLSNCGNISGRLPPGSCLITICVLSWSWGPILYLEAQVLHQPHLLGSPPASNSNDTSARAMLIGSELRGSSGSPHTPRPRLVSFGPLPLTKS